MVAEADEPGLELANRQSPIERLAEQSYMLIVVALSLMAAVNFWVTRESPLTPPPIIVGGIPLLAALWNTLLGVYAVLVVWGLAWNRRRYEAAGHVCLIVAVLIQAAAVAVYKIPDNGELVTILVDLFAALMAAARIWYLRRPLRATLTARQPNGVPVEDPVYGSHADRTSRPGAGTETQET